MNRPELFDEDFLKKLARLKWLVQKTVYSGTGGEKSLRQKGGRLEFSDYRKYSPGDETRYIDWNIFGRTEKLFIKEFAREESFPVYLLLDTTTSMKTPGPARNKTKGIKFKYTCQIAAALGYIGLITRNRLQLFGFSDKTLKHSPVFQKENQIFGALKFLESLIPHGETHLTLILNSLNKQIRKKGLLILISDLMGFQPASPAGKPESESLAIAGLAPLSAGREILEFVRRGFDVSIFHLLDQEEEQPFAPPWRDGPVKLKDSETGATKTVFINKKIELLYRQTLKQFIEEWHSFCLQHGIKYFHVDTPAGAGLETLILTFLRQGGLLK
ncbi:MAG: DUF58 domain-containing protein [Planctomycetota bacterium]